MVASANGTMNEDRAAVRALGIAIGIGRIVYASGPIPAGHLYAQLMGSMTLADFDNAIGFLIDQRLIRRDGHVLTWIGDD